MIDAMIEALGLCFAICCVLAFIPWLLCKIEYYVNVKIIKKYRKGE